MLKDDDDLWRLKMGRLVQTDERVAEELFRFRRPSGGRHLSARALAWRGRHVDGGWRLNTGPQVVVKAAGTRKSRAGVYACVHYVARLRERDERPAPLFDEFARPVAPGRVRDVLADWQLDADEANLSRRERQRRAREREAPSLSERERLHHVQGWHFVFSIVGDDDDAETVDALRRAAAVTIDANFTRKGYRVLWAPHFDRPGRPHVHVVVKALSELGGRLHCDRHGDLFDTLRSDFAANLFAAGLSFHAARREDRREVRTRIMAGEEELRWPKGRGDGDLPRRAPRWFAYFGPELVRRLEPPLPPRQDAWWRRLAQKVVGKPADPPPPAEYADVVAALRPLFRDPVGALASWQYLMMEGASRLPSGRPHYPGRALALWYARRRPEIFGELQPERRPSDVARAAAALVQLPDLPPEVVPPRLPPLDPAVIASYDRLRWQARTRRDRRRVTASLRRLAAMVADRSGNVALARRILLDLAAAPAHPQAPPPRRLGEAMPRKKGGATTSAAAETVGTVPSSPLPETELPGKPKPSVTVPRGRARSVGTEW